ncbi:hypothetical protein PROFUN_06366 [Planoprotostelium fungivorum]|uniref:Nucleoside diphosphate-linked moiety X motif 6 n=1 Tax=Planoprotostelium fungivorum TaxID=1890364 RepID=A0A2P6NNP2_9EUKA|nr:hypothetical protein PROFUN_06366 [Planoprotostelium fungivorum]
MSATKDVKSPLVELKIPELQRLPNTPLRAEADHYSGVIVDHKSLSSDAGSFNDELSESLRIWKDNNKKGVWIKIPIDRSELIPVAVSLGFIFHHAQKDYLMLVQWLPSTTSTIPSYVTHYIGVGGLVMNDNREVLCIKEKNGPIKGFWKIPGGMVDSGEEITDAAVREVFEETGIRTEFQSLICFRQSNGHAFGMSDLYFICRLKLIGDTNITKQETEISEAAWLPMERFEQLPYGDGVYSKILRLQGLNCKGEYDGWKSETLPIGFRPGENVLYHGCDHCTLVILCPSIQIWNRATEYGDTYQLVSLEDIQLNQMRETKDRSFFSPFFLTSDTTDVGYCNIRRFRFTKSFIIDVERKGSELAWSFSQLSSSKKTNIVDEMTYLTDSRVSSTSTMRSSIHMSQPEFIVECLKERNFVPLQNLAKRIDPSQLHALAEEVWIFCEDFDWEILRWFSKSKEEIAPLGHLEFPDLLLKQLALGDFSLNFHRRHLAPYFQRAKDAADLMEGLTVDIPTVASMIDRLFCELIENLVHLPVQLRILSMESRGEGGRGVEVLNKQLREFFMWNMFPLLNRPAAFGYTDIDDRPEMKAVLEECSKVVANACRQKQLKKYDPYKALYVEWNDKLNEAFDRAIEVEEVKTAQHIFTAQLPLNDRKLRRNAKKLTEYIDDLLGDSGSEISSLHGVPLELEAHQKEALLKKLYLNWKVFKSYGFGDIFSYRSPSITTGTHARVEVWLKGEVKDVVERVFHGLFNRPDFMDVKVTEQCNGYRQVNYRKRMPFPYSQRYVNVNTWTTVDDKEGVIYIEDNAEHQGKPKGCERARLQASGVYVKKYNEVLKVDILWHVILGGNIPEWMVSYWTNITAKSLSLLARKIKEKQ